MKKLPGLLDVSSDQQNGGLESYLAYDRERAATVGLTPQTIDTNLYAAFGQSQVSVIYTQLNQYYVVLEVAPKYARSPAGLEDVYLRGGGAGPDSTRLATVSTMRLATTPLLVNHTGLVSRPLWSPSRSTSRRACR